MAKRFFEQDDLDLQDYSDLMWRDDFRSITVFDAIPETIIFAPQPPANMNMSHPLLDAPAMSIEVTSIRTDGGLQGFAINGPYTDHYGAQSISSIGDINGDGYDDMFLGSEYASPNGALSGQSYVIFGSAAGYTSDFNLTSLDGTNGFTIKGIAANDFSGARVSSAGDLNNDGIGDLLIGAYGVDTAAGANAGAAYVLFGSNTGYSASIELADLLPANGGTGADGFVIDGIVAGGSLGNGASNIGDINDDGIDDIAVSAPDANGTGTVYVVYGTASGHSGSFDLASLDGTNGFVVNGAASGGLTGFNVSWADDVNNDGIDDMLIGAWGADSAGRDSGTSYVVYGSDTGFSASFNLSSLDGTNGYAMTGFGNDANSGFSVSGLGDVNGDGFADVVVGAFRAYQNSHVFSGQSYVVFGDGIGHGGLLNLANLNGTNGFSIDGYGGYLVSGYAVSDAGDFNGDGYADILVSGHAGQPNGNLQEGQGYLVYGSASGHSGTFDLGAIDGTNGFYINGNGYQHFTSAVLSGAGDVNNDGYDDILVNAQGDDTNGTSSGTTYLIYGTASLQRRDTNLTSGDDVYSASSDSETIYGLEGNDTIDGINGTTLGANDVIFGGDGNDSIRPWGGADYIDGGEGSDTINYYWQVNGVAVDVDLERGVQYGGYAEGDVLINIENINGTYQDDILAGDDNDNFIYGNRGNDLIYGRGGNDTLVGGPFESDILEGGAGADTLLGDSGGNVASYRSSDAGVTVDLGTGTAFGGHADGDTFHLIVSLYGSDFNDTLTTMDGFGGGLYGFGGNDRLTGDTSANILDGGDGVDLLVGSYGSDTLTGGAGFDTVSYAAGATEAVTVNLGGTGTGGMANGDTYNGIERIIGTHFDDTINGSAGNEFLHGEDGNDTINGGDGIDRIYGGDGDDIQRGDGGNDTLYGSAGADQLNGGVGNDSVRYTEAESAVELDMATGGTVGDAAGDTYFGIESIYGSLFDDVITGTSGTNELRGDDGDDVLDGAAGNDRLFGGAGADTLIGGDGLDRAHYNVATAAVTLDLATGGTGGEAAGDTYSSIEWVIGSNFDDDITGDAAANRLLGGEGNDTLDGAGGNDRIQGGNGNDIINGGDGIDTLFGEAGDDMLFGGNDSDFFFGGAGADSHDGGAGFDTISYLAGDVGIVTDLGGVGTAGAADGDSYANIERVFATNFDDEVMGGSGDETILGLGGDDLLGGGIGADRLFGGAGDDSFIFDTTKDGADIIQDFRAGALGNEVIHIEGGDPAFDTFAEVMAVASQVGNNTVFDFGGGNILTLVNSLMSRLNSDDFDFSPPPPTQELWGEADIAEDFGLI